GGTSLAREATAIGRALEAGDVAAARARLPHLCGRDPQALDADGIARAVVESVAENTSDAVVGALVWGAVAGVPGLLGFRAVNTLDAMVGHKSPRYRRYG
ncbi:cobalamin biosynthesis protein, partial [Streptomyces sp. SID5914]